VLLPYKAYADNAATFQAVHLGTVSIAIAPRDVSIPAGTLTVVVETPDRLGESHPDVDEAIVAAAHRSGIPPQFLKAHAAQESTSRFDRTAYRYEPIGPFVGDLLAVSRENDFRVAKPYDGYRLATAADSLDAALDQGALMIDADRDVRSLFFIGCKSDGTGGRAILPADTLVSAWEIVRCNDARLRMNWQRVAGRAGAARVKALQDDPFTAQTGLAASFGLLQMTYVTAIDEMKWAGDDDQKKNPSLLFDTDENLARHGGSLYVGAEKVCRDFTNVTGATVIDTPALLLEKFSAAWQRYNRRKRTYAAEIVLKIPLFPPVAIHPVLGGNP
jgi:hypothetical protein